MPRPFGGAFFAEGGFFYGSWGWSSPSHVLTSKKQTVPLELVSFVEPLGLSSFFGTLTEFLAPCAGTQFAHSVLGEFRIGHAISVEPSMPLIVVSRGVLSD